VRLVVEVAAVVGSWAIGRVAGIVPAAAPAATVATLPPPASEPIYTEIESPLEGDLFPQARVGRAVRAGETIAHIGARPLSTPMGGVLEGWLHPVGTRVHREQAVCVIREEVCQ
jgi:hypothetical protein